MRIIELIIDEERIQDGVEAISIVDRPAIRQNFITLSEQEKVKLAEVDNERRVLMGAVLIPNQIIPRVDEATGEEYCVFFSPETIRTASELYFKRENQSNSTYEHQEEKLEGTCIVESWIIEDDVHDKSRKFGLSHPVGTWMVAKKIYNDSVWNEYVETGLVKGFSIEGFFSEGLNSYDLSEHRLGLSEEEADYVLSKVEGMISDKLNELNS